MTMKITNRTYGGALGMFVVVGITAASAIGCNAGPEPEPRASTSQRATEGDGECGFYEKRTCNPNEVIEYYEKDMLKLAEDVAGCAGCAQALVGGAFVAAGGTIGSGGLCTIAAGALSATIATLGCTACWRDMNDSGLIRSAECALFPCEYSTEGRQKECEQICAPQLAFVPQVGYACQCTDNPTEVSCRIKCDQGYQINENCTCDALPPPPPEPPPPECNEGNDGYSCSADPDTQRDRVCCQGQCVIWECSACDTNPYCPGR
jgi:hypothetical protein